MNNMFYGIYTAVVLFVATNDLQAIAAEVQAYKQETTTEVVVAPAADYAAFDQLLQKFVDAKGNVNYQGLKANGGLDKVIATLAANVVGSDQSDNEQLAYWMNVYNAFTLKLIVDNLPLASITDLDKPWDKPIVKVGGKTYTLNQVENEILRGFNDPLIHFGINCASASCPQLMNRAFTKDNVQAGLELLARKFLADKTRNRVSANSAVVSKIFDWYSVDFVSSGTLIDFLNEYAPEEIKEGTTIKYMEYSWALNKQ